MQTRVTLPPYETTRLAYLTLAAPSRKEAIELAQHYRQWTYINGAFNASGKEAEYEMMRLNLASSNLERIQKLLSALLYPSPVLRADPDTLAANTLGQPGLWPFSISGDYPIMLVRLKGENGLQLLTELLQAHTYWRRRGLMIDLVILNQRETSYNQGLAGQIHHLLLETESEAWLNRRGGIFILREDQFGATESILLAAAARVILDDDAGSLDEQLRKLDRQPVRLPHFVAIHEPYTSPIVSGRIKRPEGLLFDNGLGGFTPDGREYVIYLEPGQWTPAPWINVIANPDFGFLVSNNGLGCTWAQNSGENRLTPWHNDPVSDPPSEAVYLRDEDTGQLWSPTPLPARANAPYLIRHGAGYSVFEHESHGLGQVMRLFAVPEEPVKIVQIKLENKTPRTRRINVTYYAEWVLGNTRDITAQYVVPEFDSRRFALLARNPYNVEFAQRVAFLAATRELHWVTTDRAEFLGVIGNYARPAALERVGLTASVRAGFDPCAAVQILLWLAPGETKEVSFLLGQGADRSAAEQLISHYQSIDHIDKAWESVAPFWERHLGAVQVKTPDPAMDILLNRWLLYQALSCRIWGRTAFYQSSGAFGFRDQLQDVLALLDCRPDLVRDHLLLAASRQFEEGDVLHWWHPPSGRGIRTRISDNLLWLPYITAKYVETTGDVSLLGVNIPFLRGEPLKEGEDERYGLFLPGTQEGTLYEHCLRAIRKGVTAGAHGLPLMGAGDWNDGMNRVGIEGKGESIWLGWFAFTTLTSFAGVCEKMEDFSQAEAFRRQAETLQQVLEAFGWDGKWYRRAYFDDGTALGSVERRECQIDSISQSWAVLSGAADPERARQAMDSLYERLVRPDDGIILLLDPPFNLTLRDPGYIKGYPPGIRENGGQYTHAATWASWAFVRLGQGQRAVELFRMMNPIYHSDSPQKVGRYRVEPYVIAADVYSVPPYTGRGGWTWYTGSASWMYRLGLEAILGLRREQERLYLSPAIPADWPSYEIHYRFGRSVYHIHVDCSQGKNGPVESVMLDGKITGVKFIPLVDDGQEHQVVVTLK
jgi:cyclic beta-1,2-glucan synthetase